MKVFFGLGNIGDKYVNTRHNVGFRFIDFVIKKIGESEFSRKDNHNGVIYSTLYEEEKLLLVKPLTFMNLSGDCIQKIIRYYKVSIEDILVIHDDLDIPLGGLKLQVAKGPKGHNGLIDIERKIGTSEFLRLRIGVENRKDKMVSGDSYVLRDFSQEELSVIFEVFERSWEVVKNTLICETG